MSAPKEATKREYADMARALALAVQLYQGEGLGQPMAFETVRQRGALDRSEMGRFSIVE